jgi:RNA polymerase sigma factor (TIGR02999 family)
VSVAVDGRISEGELQTLWTGFVAGQPRAVERLLALHYAEFRQLARRILATDAARLQIQPTDLAHEAAIRVMRLDRMTPKDRTHFLALSARVMRQTLMDEVRRYRAAKRNPPPLTTRWLAGAGGVPAPARAIDLEAMDEALRRLEGVDADLATLVEQRFFAGLTVEEIAAETGQSESTVKRRWRTARAWLLSELGAG